MTKKLPKRGLPPMHPGELLREEILPALNRPKTEIAKLLGVSRQTLYDIIEERRQFRVMKLRPAVHDALSRGRKLSDDYFTDLFRRSFPRFLGGDCNAARSVKSVSAE